MKLLYGYLLWSILAVVGMGPLTHIASVQSGPPGSQYLWLKGNVGLTNVGTTSVAWADQSGNGHNCTWGAGTASNLTTSSINSITTLAWLSGGTKSYLTCTTAALNGQATWTIGVVFEYTGGVYNSTTLWYNPALFADNFGYYGAYVADNGGTFAIAENYVTIENVATVTGGSLGIPQYMIMQLSGGVLSVSINGGTAATVASGTTHTASANAYVGYSGFVQTTNQYQGQIGEILVYEYAANVGQIAGYFHNRWNI